MTRYPPPPVQSPLTLHDGVECSPSPQLLLCVENVPAMRTTTRKRKRPNHDQGDQDGAVHPLVDTLLDQAHSHQDGGVQSLQLLQDLGDQKGGVQPLVDTEHGHGLQAGLGAPKPPKKAWRLQGQEKSKSSSLPDVIPEANPKLPPAVVCKKAKTHAIMKWCLISIILKLSGWNMQKMSKQKLLLLSLILIILPDFFCNFKK